MRRMALPDSPRKGSRVASEEAVATGEAGEAGNVAPALTDSGVDVGTGAPGRVMEGLTAGAIDTIGACGATGTVVWA